MIDESSDNDNHQENEVSMVLLLKTENYLKAQLVVGALEERGIPTVSKRLGLGDRTGIGGISHVVCEAPRPAEVYVNSIDLDRARGIMEDMTIEDSEDNK